MTKDNAIAEANKWSKQFESEEDIQHRAMDIYAKYWADKAWEACESHMAEQNNYPYGKRGGVYQYPNKEQFLNSIK